MKSMTVRGFVSSVSPKGQITIPMEIRRMLDIKPKDKVAIQFDEGTVTITPAHVRLDSFYQQVSALGQPRDINELTEIAADEHAHKAARAGLPHDDTRIS
jgi:AbrB family looped-hinge helix DNA binding protein